MVGECPPPLPAHSPPLLLPPLFHSKGCVCVCVEQQEQQQRGQESGGLAGASAYLSPAPRPFPPQGLGGAEVSASPGKGGSIQHAASGTIPGSVLP